MDIELSFPGGKRVVAQVGAHRIETDQPHELGGKDAAPAPFDLFLASIATCAGIYALGFCDRAGKLQYASSAFPNAVKCAATDVPESRNWVLQLADGPLHVSANPVSYEDALLGQLVIVHDMSFVQRRSDDTKKYVLWLFAAIAAVVALITVVIAEISWRGWVAGLKALSGPFPQMQFCPTGGVSLANLGNYLALPQVICVGGSWLVPADAVKNRDWAQVTKLSREARERVAELRG